MSRTSRFISTLLAAFMVVSGAGVGNSDAASAQGPDQGREQQADVGGIKGTLLRPAISGPHPAVLIVGGAGPIDRDGNNGGVGSNNYRMLAYALADAGIASLRYDKRGVGASAGGSSIEMTVNVYAADVAGMANWLKAQSGISKVVVVGHSDGALQALIAADLVQAAGFALLCAPGREPGILLREQLTRQPLSDGDRSAGISIMNALESDIDIGVVPVSLQDMFRPSVQPLLRSILRLDPQMLLVNRREPILIAGGGADLSVTRADVDALLTARRDATVIWSPGMTHTMKNADPADPRQRNIATDAARPLAADLVTGLIAFVKK